MDKEESPKGMSRRDFLKTAAVGALGIGSGLGSLYSDDIGEGVYEDKKPKDEKPNYRNKKITILDFRYQGDKDTGIYGYEVDMGRMIPDMLTERLKNHGVEVVDKGILLRELIESRILDEYGISFADFSECPSVAAGKINDIDVIDGSYTQNYITSRYINLSTGEVAKVFKVSGSINFLLDDTINALANKILDFIKNG